MEKPYILQHKNTMVAVFLIDENGTIMEVGDNINEKYLPILCSGGISLKTWWAERSIPVNRHGIQEDLLDKRITSSRQLLVQNLGLSLTDCYWLKPVDSSYQWKDVNLYENSFQDKVISLDTCEEIMKDLRASSPFIPSASLQGELKKKWIIIDGERILIKGNYGSNIQQSLNEVFASLLHKKQGRYPYTEYQLVKLNSSEGETIGCACKNFCNITTEFISAREIAYSYKKSNSQSEYEAYISYANANGLDIRPFMEYQIATDFILTNTDRHFNNFGLLRDSDSLNYLGPAPIFDSGNCLFFRGTVPNQKSLYDIPVTSFRKRETDLLRYITNPNIITIDQLPTVNELNRILQINIHMPEERRAAICQGYMSKIQIYTDFLNGAEVWSFKYRK